VQAALKKLNPVPATELSRVSSDWETLDTYVAQQAYQVVYGSELVPQFYGDRIDFPSAVFHPTYYNDWSTVQLKG
jgi:hypothetical protein